MNHRQEIQTISDDVHSVPTVMRRRVGADAYRAQAAGRVIVWHQNYEGEPQVHATVSIVQISAGADTLDAAKCDAVAAAIQILTDTLAEATAAASATNPIATDAPTDP